jgi:adenosylhomocysteine nucleosidase
MAAMSGDPLSGDIRSLLNEWKARGWKDVDEAAIRIARARAGGAMPQIAAREAGKPFLASNRIARADLVAAIAAADSSPSQVPVLTSVIFTALALEHRAVCEELTELTRVTTRRGTVFDIGQIGGEDLEWRVAVAQVGTGNLGAAAETTAAIEQFQPDLVMFVGIAGAVSGELQLGSVIVADRVYYYEGGRSDADGWKSRPLAFPTSHRLRQHAMVLARDWDGSPVVVAPIAAGEALVGSSRSEVGRRVRQHYNDAVGVDMESAGLYHAAHSAETTALAVRGVSDHLDDKLPNTDVHSQPEAARGAARFAIALLRTATTETIIGS